MKKYRLEIPKEHLRWVRNSLAARQGEISDTWDDALLELGWLKEVDEPNSCREWARERNIHFTTALEDAWNAAIVNYKLSVVNETDKKVKELTAEYDQKLKISLEKSLVISAKMEKAMAEELRLCHSNKSEYEFERQSIEQAKQQIYVKVKADLDTLLDHTSVPGINRLGRSLMISAATDGLGTLLGHFPVPELNGMKSKVNKFYKSHGIYLHVISDCSNSILFCSGTVIVEAFSPGGLEPYITECDEAILTEEISNDDFLSASWAAPD